MISWIASTIFGVHYSLRNFRICQTVLRRRLRISTGLTTGKSCRVYRCMTRLLSSLVRVCAGIICRYMAIPCQPHRG
ncbi:hypothetical protein DTY43_26620 [Escherichia coli]|nr:hypothetical protein [Escherichia coli]